MEEYTKEPCPARIVDDCGSAFALGTFGGVVFQTVRGFRNGPNGFRRRLASSLDAIKTRAPKTAGSFALWGVLFSTVDCTCSCIRKKEDPWNSIISGAFTSSVLVARNGVGAMAGSAVVGGVLLGIIEGINILYTRLLADAFYPQAVNYEKDEEEEELHYYEQNF